MLLNRFISVSAGRTTSSTNKRMKQRDENKEMNQYFAIEGNFLLRIQRKSFVDGALDWRHVTNKQGDSNFLSYSMIILLLCNNLLLFSNLLIRKLTLDKWELKIFSGLLSQVVHHVNIEKTQTRKVSLQTLQLIFLSGTQVLGT